MRNPAELRARHPGEDELWAVDADRQCLLRWTGNRWLDPEPVSTSRHGFGNDEGSFRTPLGPHRVCEVIGVGAPLGQPFVSREPAGPPVERFDAGGEDAVLTRILWLDGLEPGLNHRSRGRYIYLHGTNREDRLGLPASRGCVRMRNRTIAAWADALGPRRPLVWIGAFEEL